MTLMHVTLTRVLVQAGDILPQASSRLLGSTRTASNPGSATAFQGMRVRRCIRHSMVTRPVGSMVCRSQAWPSGSRLGTSRHSEVRRRSRRWLLLTAGSRGGLVPYLRPLCSREGQARAGCPCHLRVGCLSRLKAAFSCHPSASTLCRQPLGRKLAR